MKLLALVGLLAICGACAGEDQVSGDRRTVGVMTVVFSVTPARVQVGRNVTLTIRVSNNGGKTEHLVSPSGKLYDFWVKKGSREVWRWSSERAFVQTVTTTDITSQSTHTFTESWSPAVAGTLTAYGELTAEGFTGSMKGKVVVQ